MVNDLFDGSHGFAIDGGIKDSTHIRKLAAEMNSPMPALVRPVSLLPSRTALTLTYSSLPLVASSTSMPIGDVIH